MSGVAKVGAWMIRASTAVDAAFRHFDRLRSAGVARIASHAVLDAYNDMAYGASGTYEAGTPAFRHTMFHWEEDLLRRVFPPPPGRVLIGGAGGGREAFAWAAQGYDVVAFEPSPRLARSMARQAAAYPGVTAWESRYERLPELRAVESGEPVDVRTLGPFAGAIFGWASYSHLRDRTARIAALRQVAALTDGPLVVSFYLLHQRAGRRERRLRRLGRLVGLHPNGDMFSPHIGFYHWSTQAEIEGEMREAGLEMVDHCYDDQDARWPWIAARRSPS